MDIMTAKELDDESDTTALRKELSNKSFEELLHLKEELGSKDYNEAVFGTSTRKTVDYKRANKNRPREQSSKIPVTPLREVFTVKKKVSRDPRFDSLCGSFNEKLFKTSYSFLSEVKQQELNELKQELKKTEDPGREEKIKYLIQRLENQKHEESRRKIKAQKKEEEREAQIKMLQGGKRPNFMKPSEKRVLELVERYKELKEKGKLKKHIQKQRKKTAMKDRKKLKEQRKFVG